MAPVPTESQQPLWQTSRQLQNLETQWRGKQVTDLSNKYLMIHQMTNVLLCGCKVKPWLNVIRSIPNWKLAYWFGWDDDLDDVSISKTLGYEPYLHKFSLAWHGEGYPFAIAPKLIDEEILNQLSAEELTALSMMDRLEPKPGSFNFRDRRRYWRSLLGKSLAIIEAYDINLVVAAVPPHRVFDYALYAACAYKNIPFLSFATTPFGPRSIIIDQVRKLPDYVASGLISGGFDCENRPGLDEIDERVHAAKGLRERSWPKYMTEQNETESRLLSIVNLTKVAFKTAKGILLTRNNHRVVDFKIPDKGVETGSMPLLKYRRLQFMEIAAAYRLRRLYGKMVDYRRSEEIKGNFILFALHYQPEETTCPTGGVYCDQTLVIEILDKVIPEGFDIVVKEHPSQFKLTMQGGRGRTRRDYEYMKRISRRVKFISAETNAVDLIDKAIAVVTISGTIGWESAVRGTPVIIFGRAWYEGMPKVFKVSGGKELGDHWLNIVEAKKRDESSRIADYHKRLEQYLVYAVQYKGFEGQFPLTNEQSCEGILIGLKQYFDAINKSMVMASAPFSQYLSSDDKDLS